MSWLYSREIREGYETYAIILHGSLISRFQCLSPYLHLGVMRSFMDVTLFPVVMALLQSLVSFQ